MPLTVYKYSLSRSGKLQTLPLPGGARVFSAAMQREDLQLWALVDPQSQTVSRHFIVCGTGHPLSADERNLVFIETVVDGPFVWHVFEVVY